MEFKSLRNIESSFKQLRLFTLVVVVASIAISIYSIASAYNFAEKQRQKIYVLDEGKSLMLALSQDVTQNRPVEARDHVMRFHELFFTLSPDRSAIESNINRAFNLSDKSAYDYFKDLSEKGYYNRLISGNISQVVQIDSVICNFDIYPYRITTYAKQIIIRQSNISTRNLKTSCQLMNTSRSDNNPHGFMIEDFKVVDNREIQTVER